MGESAESWRAEFGKLFDLASLRLKLDIHKAKGHHSIALSALASDYRKKEVEVMSGPVLGPLGLEEKKEIMRAAIAWIQRIDQPNRSAQARAELAEKRAQDAELQVMELRGENDELREQILELEKRLQGDVRALESDPEVIAFAGLFKHALTVSETVFAAAGVAATSVWTVVRQEAHELLCTDSERYASRRKLAKASVNAASLFLAEAVMKHFELSEKYASTASNLFLAVCDAGRSQ